MEMKKEFKQLYEYLNNAFGNVQEQFNGVQEQFNDVQGSMETQFSEIRSGISDIRSDVVSIRSQMVTKSYLDDKLADLKGDLITLTKKEDNKINRLVGILHDKSVLDRNDVNELSEYRVFPKH